MSMNLPNKLTIFRCILIVPFVALLLNGYDLFATIIFVIASLTDLLDGKIARKYNLVTNFGKFMDPLADKLLVCSALICLLALGRINVFLVLVIIVRDFIISGFRLVASDKGVVIAANMWGKVKTTIQMISMVIAILFGTSEISFLYWISQASIYLSTLATLISGISYIYDYRKVFEK